jgi:hypothetical protein
MNGITKAQSATIERFVSMGYEVEFTEIPLGRGALLVHLSKAKIVDCLDITVNVNGSYHLAWTEDLAA